MESLGPGPAEPVSAGSVAPSEPQESAGGIFLGRNDDGTMDDMNDMVVSYSYGKSPCFFLEDPLFSKF